MLDPHFRSRPAVGTYMSDQCHRLGQRHAGASTSVIGGIIAGDHDEAAPRIAGVEKDEG